MGLIEIISEEGHMNKNGSYSVKRKTRTVKREE